MTMEKTMSRLEANDKKPLKETEPTATAADVDRTMRNQKQDLYEKYISELQTGPDVYSNSPSPAEIKEPVFTHEVMMGGNMSSVPIELEVENTAPQEGQVFVLNEVPEPAPLLVEVAPEQQSEPEPVSTPTEEVQEPAPYIDHFAVGLKKETEPEAAQPLVEAPVQAPVQVQAPVEAPVKEPVVAPAEIIPVVPVPVAEVAKDAGTTPEDVIPEDVVAEVASTLKRADFVKQQEEAWGANDDIKAEDVPEGEMTYEQYLAQRPVAEEGDFYHHNNRVYNAVPTAPMKNKKAIYEDKLNASSSAEYYERSLTEANQTDAIDDATKEGEFKNESNDRILRTNVEGEFLVEKDARLRGLLSVGEELLTLYNSELTGEEFEKKIRPQLEATQATYDNLYELYENKGLDNRALWYIQDKTGARVEDPEFIPVEGSAFINGEKVDILNLVETSGGKKVYTIEKADGSVEAVYSDEVTFKREFEKYEAPEGEVPVPVTEAVSESEAEVPEQSQEQESPEVEPEEKLSRFERTKKWLSKEGDKLNEFGIRAYGMAYIGNLWNKPKNWLTSRHIDEEKMTPEMIQTQKGINRRHNAIGFAALVGLALTARGIGLIDDLTHGDFIASLQLPDIDTKSLNHGPGHIEVGNADGGAGFDGSGDTFVPHAPAAAENADLVQMHPGVEGGADTAPVMEIGNADGGAGAHTQPEVGNADGGAGAGGYEAVTQPEIGHADGGADFVPDASDGGGYEAVSFNVDNPAFNIPSGGGGLELFHELGLSDEQWKQHAPELLQQFPDVLYAENGDIRLLNEGLQPLDFRQAVVAITNR